MIYMLLKGKSVVVVFRRIDDDRIQFSKRFLEFKNKYEENFPQLKSIPMIDDVHISVKQHENQDEDEDNDEQDEELDNAKVYIGLENLSDQEKETYELIIEYLKENYSTGWNAREVIAKYLMKELDQTNHRIHARLEHLIKKGDKQDKKSEYGIVCRQKSKDARWSIKL